MTTLREWGPEFEVNFQIKFSKEPDDSPSINNVFRFTKFNSIFDNPEYGSYIPVMWTQGKPDPESILHKSNPWKGGNCGNKDCLPCVNGDGTQNCYQRNCTYTITCMECEGSKSGSEEASDNIETESEKQIFTYGGETARVVRLRSMDHVASYRNKEDKSVLWGHAQEHHGGRLDVKFKMKVHKTWNTALSRMVGEAVLITIS